VPRKDATSRHNQPKQPVLRTPEPVQNRVIARYVEGQSNRLIAREEGIDRATVARILSQQDMVELIAQYQTALLGIVPKAIRAFEEVLDSDNLHLKAATATKLLEGVGALHKAGIVRLADQPAVLERERRQQRLLILGQMAGMMMAKGEKFGTPLPPGFAGMDDALKEIEPPQ